MVTNNAVSPSAAANMWTRKPVITPNSEITPARLPWQMEREMR